MSTKKKSNPNKKVTSSSDNSNLLPNERDRKAILGCLSTTVGILHTRDLKSIQSDGSPYDDNVTAITTKGADDRRIKLSEEFYREVLKRSALFLFLGEDIATGFEMAPLDMRPAVARDLNSSDKKSLMMKDENHSRANDDDVDCNDYDVNEMFFSLYKDHLLPYRDSITSEDAAFKCITMLLFQFLIYSGDCNEEKESSLSRIKGYDARVRRILKSLASLVLSKDTFCAARKYEALETSLAKKLWHLSRKAAVDKSSSKIKGLLPSKLPKNEQNATQRGKAIKGLKIASAGVVAGTLFAVTGGLAAPAIAASISTLVGGTIIASTASLLLSSSAAVITIFGVGGGALVAQKTNNRVSGLTDFDIVKENVKTDSDSNKNETRGGNSNQYELTRTICLSGWLNDDDDFQRPWGVTPEGIKHNEKQLLERFCRVHAPEQASSVSRVLEQHTFRDGNGRRNIRPLWDLLKAVYGRDPDHLLPLWGPKYVFAITKDEDEIVNDVIESLGLPRPSNCVSLHENDRFKQKNEPDWPLPAIVVNKSSAFNYQKSRINDDVSRSPYPVWDFYTTYGGEIYTVHWERNLIKKVSDSVVTFLKDAAKGAAKEAAKNTVLASLLIATAIPATLLSVANTIDAPWTMLIERADQAGVQLANLLLKNYNAGHRPVNLVGFSFGARVIYSCLKELAQHQRNWEERQEQEQSPSITTSRIRGKHVSTELSHYSREPASVVEDAVLMGCPAPSSPVIWTAMRNVVAGRIINCYYPEDMMLNLMFRFKNIVKALSTSSGITAINVCGVENYDVSKRVSSHNDYGKSVKDILSDIEFGEARLLQI